MEILKNSTTVFNNNFSKEIYELTYKFYKDKNIQSTWERISKFLASKEKNKEKWEKEFYKILKNFKFVPGGRIISNAGINLKGVTLINCFVDGFIGEDQDSMDKILDALHRQASILKSEGGYGFNGSVLRPRGAFIRGTAAESPGAVKMLELWDTQAGVITSGSEKVLKNIKTKKKIRKGAQMVTLGIWHPDIEEFITVKQKPNTLTKFNMSSLVSDKFMKALLKDQDWELIFPDYENDSEKYKKYWDGDIDKWVGIKGKIKIYKTLKAKKLWKLIMDSTYKRNEPGILFQDIMNDNNNLYYLEKLLATNPCGEQVLPIFGSCLLGSFNLTQFVNKQRNNWDYSSLKKIIPIVIRMQDNVIDLTNLPIKEEIEELQNKRRMGIGIMGYASSLLMMKIPYGSDKAISKTKDFLRFWTNEIYKASSDLAKEKGSFPVLNIDKYVQSKFIKRALYPSTINLIKKQGIRNSHLISIQPTGNTSILANNVSGGIEPIFLTTYKRTFEISAFPEEMGYPKKIDWENQICLDEDKNVKKDWYFIESGDEFLLKNDTTSSIYYISRNRGFLKEAEIKDFGYNFLGEPKSGKFLKTIKELGIQEHLITLKTFSQFVDSSISKTINLPKNYSFEDFQDIYLTAWKTGTIKGLTTYREGTMASVLSEMGIEKENKLVIKERPLILNCDIHHLVSGKKDWMVLIGMLNDKPYEVFAFRKKWVKIPDTQQKGKLIKVKSSIYNLKVEDFLFENITKLFERDEEEALTRQISLSLRGNISIEDIIDQLTKAEGTILSFSKVLERTLRKYSNNFFKECPVCGQNKLTYSEGCIKCLACGYSKC